MDGQTDGEEEVKRRRALRAGVQGSCVWLKTPKVNMNEQGENDDKTKISPKE